MIVNFIKLLYILIVSKFFVKNILFKYIFFLERKLNINESFDFFKNFF